MKIIFLSFVMLTCTAYGQSKNGFNLKGSLVPPDEIISGGPSRDGIPAIDNPAFMDIKEARRSLPPDAKAILVEKGPLKKLYPIPILNWHEIVNDSILGVPIVVTYCPLCGTGVVFHRSFGKKNLDFGNSGLLYNSDMLLFDRLTQSLWSQLMRKAISGPMKGSPLRIYPSQVVRLFPYAKKNSKVMIMSTQTGITRDYKRVPYEGYSSSDSLLFPVKNLDKSLPIKTWSILIERKPNRMIIPITEFKNELGKKAFQVGEDKVTIFFDRKRSLLRCENKPDKYTCISGYYFALKSFYPDARVYKRQPNKVKKPSY